MNKYLIVLISFFVFVSFINCRTIVPPPPPPATVQQTQRNYRPLTFQLLREIEKQAARDGKTIEDIKFYLSNDVKLMRIDNDTTLEIDTESDSQYGAVYRSRVQNYETIIIPKFIAGFYISEAPNLSSKDGKLVLGISFDPANTNLLHFAQNGINGDDYFYLDTSNLETSTSVKYGGKNYFAILGGNEVPYLMIQFIDRAVVPDDNIKQLPGRQIKPQDDLNKSRYDITWNQQFLSEQIPYSTN